MQAWTISWTEGDDVPTARFGYVTDDRAINLGFPSQFEMLWPLVLPGGLSPYVVLPGDRLVVYCAALDGSVDLLFDGYARMPAVNVAGEQQAVSFSAVGVAIRCYDVPIQGRVQRNGSLTQCQTTDGSEDVATNLPTRFNPPSDKYPTGQANCTPDNFDTDQDGDGAGVAYPVFLDEAIDRPGDTDHSPTLWTLAKAIKYLLALYNPAGSPPPENGDDPPEGTFDAIVQNPDFTNLTALLDNYRPLDPTGFFDPQDPSSYTASPIVIREFNPTNMAWPEAVQRMLGYHGFGMRWVLGQDSDGAPQNSFAVYRKDAANTAQPKVVYLPSRGAPINPGTCNVGTMTASFDYHSLFNSVVVETHQNRYEISVILPPLFQPEHNDGKPVAQGGARETFLMSALDTATETVRRKYRWYGVDELGDGYYDLNQDQWVTGQPFDFSELWPAQQNPDTGEDVPAYCVRLRAAIRECLADDGNGDTYKAQLALSRNYDGDARALWDGSGDWQPISGDWELLEDRLGIRFTADSPEAIHCGKSHFAAQTQNGGPILKGITSIADPGTPGPTNKSDALFFLRLTCVILADQTIEGAAPRRLASPLTNEVRRRINAKDHYRRDTIHLSSAFYSEQQAANPATQTDDDGNLLTRDDTQVAKDYAAQLRTAHEFPSVPMAITIPGISLAYQPGDRVGYIQGRNISLQTNAGSEQSEAPAYPFVVSLTLDLTGDQQSSVLQLSDRRMEPQPIEHRRGR